MGKKIDILHLEDNPLDAQLIQSTLASENLESNITITKTKNEFIEALNSQKFDLIIGDYSLPAFDGITALRIMQEKCLDTPFLFVSGAIGEDLAVETLKYGAFDYVFKGNLVRLAPSVRRALREANEKIKLKRAESQLIEAEDTVKQLSQDIIQIQEDQRSTLARELHDDLGHSVVTLKLLIQSLFSDVAHTSEADQKKYGTILKELDMLTAKLSGLAHNLSPIGLRDLGLTEAITELAELFRLRNDIDVNVDLKDLDSFFANKWDINVYRLVQESLTNITKHARATRVAIMSRLLENRLILTIKDDGIGMDLAAIATPNEKGLGLLIMKTRVDHLGGIMNIISQKEEGTEIIIEIAK